MLDTNIKTQLQTYLTRATRPIAITAFVDDSNTSRELQALLADIASVSDLVSVEERRDASERTPSFALNSPGENIGIRFAGLPMGHEFTSLVLALLQVGGVAPKISEETAAQIRALKGNFDFVTYISLSCQNCPDVVQALNAMAVLNPNIRHTMVDGALFQDEVNERKIMAVPTVLLNGAVFGQGRMGIEEIVAKLDSGATDRAAEKMNTAAPFDVLVVGGGPAGAAAAVYAARKGIRTGVASERFGGQVLDTMAIENFISVQETEGPKMAMALEEHVKSYAVDILNLQRASKLVPAGDDGLTTVEFANGGQLKAKSVIVATGARWREMNVPGEAEYRGRGVAYCPHCDGPLFKGKKVAVIGGGNSGVEAAIDLAGIVAHVTLLEFGEAMRADAVLQKKLLSLPNVTVITQAQTTAVLGNGEKVTGLAYTHRATGQSHELQLDGIFVQIGLVPNTDWLKDSGVNLSRFGEIEINARGETSVPGVFAAGDATNVPYKQIIIAMGAGATASLSAFDHLIRS
ncbi:alkyl hydroperoxide reductase subunit F [Chitinilyticum litopenaei]|uniref:alkyl hydroperoxide reductase subunit F n=1 Tax=Chitinilyticum litopenaei TaxID=1121276 RepID=UPI0003F9F413|nr:alkyl hydroperoxide reductase subunit F [Chitinilyticum litopenaei]